MPNCEQIAVKNTKRLVFSRSPAWQEEKTGLARFPLAVLSLFFRLLRIRRTPSPLYGESSYKGDGEKSERGTKKEPIPQTKKHTPKRHNRQYQDRKKM